MHGIKKIIMQKNEMDPSKILVGRMQKGREFSLKHKIKKLVKPRLVANVSR